MHASSYKGSLLKNHSLPLKTQMFWSVETFVLPDPNNHPLKGLLVQCKLSHQGANWTENKTSVKKKMRRKIEKNSLGWGGVEGRQTPSPMPSASSVELRHRSLPLSEISARVSSSLAHSALETLKHWCCSSFRTYLGFLPDLFLLPCSEQSRSFPLTFRTSRTWQKHIQIKLYLHFSNVGSSKIRAKEFYFNFIAS